MRTLVWYRVTVRDRFRFRLKVIVRVTVRFRVRSQESPGAGPTAVHLSPQRAEQSAQWRLPVRNCLLFPSPDKCFRHSSGRPVESSSAVAARLLK